LLELQSQEGMILIVVTHSRRLASRMSRQFVLEAGTLNEN
jgi:predicted ABC-type transport system involved in lysophospholipase L1 biosynthesis ATPase subunit